MDSQHQELQFRVGINHDVERIAEYHHRCWLTSFASLFEPGVVERMDPLGRLDRFRFWLSPDSGMRTVVAAQGGVVVGHVIVEGNEIVHLFIDPDHQGAGTGRKLLGVGEGLIVEAGFGDAELHTMVGNEPALGLYASAGWLLTDRLIHSAHDGVEYDEHVLVKQLDVTTARRDVIEKTSPRKADPA